MLITVVVFELLLFTFIDQLLLHKILLFTHKSKQDISEGRNELLEFYSSYIFVYSLFFFILFNILRELYQKNNRLIYSLHGRLIYSLHGRLIYSLLGRLIYSLHGRLIYSLHGRPNYSLHDRFIIL